jgi:hypothetical protein
LSAGGDYVVRHTPSIADIPRESLGRRPQSLRMSWPEY